MALEILIGIRLVSFILTLWPTVLGNNVMYPDSLHNSTSCDEFSQYARFNPYSVLDVGWFVFYYWGPDMPRTEYIFRYPNPKEKAYIHYYLDEHVAVPINWTARFVVKTNLLTNESVLLVENGERGEFLLYPFLVRKKNQPKINPIHVRFKQTGDNKYIGLMICEKDIVYVMCKKKEIPRKVYIQDAAARIGYKGRNPKSYLYQGHDWMPIPEDDEEAYWISHEDKMREESILKEMIVREEMKSMTKSKDPKKR